jgi:hypothetical protein
LEGDHRPFHHGSHHEHLSPLKRQKQNLALRFAVYSNLATEMKAEQRDLHYWEEFWWSG